MASPDNHLASAADKPAVIMADSGRRVSYAEMVAGSRRWARYFRSLGLRDGDGVAILLDNCPEFFELCWAAQRSGLYLIPINWHLQPGEVAFIVADSGARLVVTRASLGGVVADLRARLAPDVQVTMLEDACRPGSPLMAQAVEPLADEREGQPMLYSSGTTGRPRGIKRALTGQPFGAGSPFDDFLRGSFRMDADTVYLNPAPMYHAAPLGTAMLQHRLGGTVLVMESFDAVRALRAIEEHRVTHAQWVPTHFVRMLKLADAERLRHDHSSLRVVIHAAAPCPPDVKRRMIDWWGPILYEFYGATEGHGFTLIDTPQWLAHPGSVGRPALGLLHVLDAQGNELPAGEDGLVYFSGAGTFSYHNDPEKTAQVRDAQGRTTVGDIGHVDAQGYLYLTERQSHVIISGGVNIYPQEVEGALALHPAIDDVAVIGVPNEEFGEEVKAFVVAADPAQAGPGLGAEIIGYCRARLAHFKCPRSVEFVSALPRQPNGKLLKRLLLPPA